MTKLLGNWRRKRREKRKSQVVFYSYPKLIFVWPLIVAGFAFWPLAEWGWVSATALGWWYMLVLGLVILTIGIDLERDHAFVWLVIFATFFFLGRWLQDAQGFTLFGDVYDWFATREINYDKDNGLVLSILLVPPYIVMWFWARLQHKWRITHNEFEHYSWGRADDSLARGAKRFRSTFPDLLELLLCGSGTLIVYSATGRSELLRIPHVPMVFWVRRRINRLLESTQVTQAQLDEIESEQTAAEEEEAPPSQEVDSGRPGDGSRDPL